MVFSGFTNIESGATGPPFIETSAFMAVLEQKSFTRAAKQLGLSPSRVSEFMRGLEESLRVRLVERTTRSVTATATGERLLARLRPELDEYEASVHCLRRLDAPWCSSRRKSTKALSGGRI
jgi:DNA-binding transcriptional LysR family regulator